MDAFFLRNDGRGSPLRCFFGNGEGWQRRDCGEPVTQTVHVDGREVEMSGYMIADSNYIKLRDVGELMDFNAYWEDGVYLDSASS